MINPLNNNKLKLIIRPGILILLMIIFILSGQNLNAQKKPAKKESHFEADASFATIYDNNILKYSEKYLDRFMNRQDSGRFHIETYDDIIFYQSADLYATYKIFKNLKSRFSINYFGNAYLVNNIKNWYTLSAGYQQYITKRASFKIQYNYIPHFYVRHFRDQDLVDIYGYTPETFVPYSFSKDNYSFWIQNTFMKNTRVKLAFDYSVYYYNKHYTEYDSKNYIGGLFLYQPLSDDIRLDLGYEYEYSDAKGYDQPGETRETADDANATFYENGFLLALNWDLPKLEKIEHSLNARVGYQRRTYTSDHYIEEDPEHVGRIDDNLQVAATYDISFNKALTLSAFYRFYFRNSDSKSDINQAYLSEEKDYRQSQVGLQLNFTTDFKCKDQKKSSKK